MRNHPLTVGEVVFDLNQSYFGVIVELGENYARLDMNGKTDQVRPGWCEYENRLMFDEEIPENELVWETKSLGSLYQVAWGTTDLRTGNIVCYEHIPFEDGYPYYSPYLEENLFNFEVDAR